MILNIFNRCKEMDKESGNADKLAILIEKMSMLSKEELITCMDKLGYIKELPVENIEITDIDVFFGKFTKSNNDATNKKRETIIKLILNKTIPKHWYSFNENIYGKKWFNVAYELKKFIELLSKTELQTVEQKAGRNFNYDFLFTFKGVPEMKIEFKNGVKSIDEYPEILSVASSSFIKGTSYAEYYYDNFLPDLENKPTKEFYLKNIHKNVVDHPFFHRLKELDNFKDQVNTSIHNYLEIVDFDFDAFEEKIKQQENKTFMLWKDEQFHIDQINQIKIDKHFTLKKGRTGNNTTLVIKAGDIEFHLLLRWKNHAGVLYPAWQIKLKRIHR